MANWKEIAVDQISAKNTGETIKYGDKQAYVVAYGSLDFADDDIPNWRAVKAVSTRSVPYDITVAALTAIPFFLDASLYPGASENSEIIAKISFPDQTTGISTGKPVRVYDILAVEQDTNGDGTGTFTGWNIYGHPNGSGQFNEDTFITIKL